MSKYDFEIDLSEQTSTGKLISKLEKGMTVLEFGCATGRMTRYMKDVLQCDVYIVEYDQSAFDLAIQYAVDGICDDLLTLSWLEKFKDIRFDIIFFADVLEHLSNPKKAIINAKKLLKNCGQICFSIPNITHNDILIKGLYNNFDYTNVGLLDDTHIHFWGLNNIEEFVKTCGMNLKMLEATYCITGGTEQKAEVSKIDTTLLNYFRMRSAGEIYQFVVTADLSQDETKIDLKRPTMNVQIYFDYGQGFNFENMMLAQSECVEHGTYVTDIVISDTSNLCQIRLDPVEGQGCLLTEISVKQDGEELPVSYSDSVQMDEGILLSGMDPMVIAIVKKKDRPVSIHTKMILATDQYVDFLNKKCIKQYRENVFLNEKNTIIQGQLQEKDTHILNYQEIKLILEGEIENLRRDVRDKELICNQLQNEKQFLLNKVDECENSIAEKEKNILECENIIKDYSLLITQKDYEILQKEEKIRTQIEEIKRFEEIVNYYKNLKVVRFRAFMVRIIKKILRR